MSRIVAFLLVLSAMAAQAAQVGNVPPPEFLEGALSAPVGPGMLLRWPCGEEECWVRPFESGP